MSSDLSETLLELFSKAGVLSSVDFFERQEDKTAVVQGLVERMDAAVQSYATRFSSELSSAMPLSLSSLEQVQSENPHKLKAFLQALDATSNPDMLVMVWRILQGDLIKAVDMKYEGEGAFSLDVALEDPETGASSRYRSQDIDDAALVRHFGIMKLGDRPLFDGFYALRT